jgi:type IV secretory pathway TraG/TraD family ATPase VirD4
LSTATLSQIYQHHRMLSASEARRRQVWLSLSLAAVLSFFFLCSRLLMFATVFASSAYFFYTTIDLFIPNDFFSGRQPPIPEHAEGDLPAYADEPKSPDVLHRIQDLVLLPPGVVALKLTSCILAGALSLGMTYRASGLFLFLFQLLLNTVSLFLLCSWFLRHIEARHIPDYPERTYDKFLFEFSRMFSCSRGYYFIGEVKGKKIGLRRTSRYMHTLIAGPTGEGKSTSFIIGQLLFDADSVGSAVVPDAKSPELFNWVAGRWLANGKKVYLFDPWDSNTVGINFLPDAEDQDLLTIVEVLMREREEVLGKEDPFFKARTRYLLYAIFKLVQTYDDKYCNMSTVYHIVQSVETLVHCVNASPDPIKRLFQDFGMLREETEVNAVNSIKEKLDFFMSENVRKAFSRSEFKLEDLFAQGSPCLLIIGSPVDKQELGSKISSLIINLIINMAFRERRLYNQAVQRREREIEPNDLYLYADELRTLRITALGNLVSIARAAKTQVIASVTDYGFLRAYREEYSGLMSNFRTRIATSGLDYDSAKYLSESLGKQNINTYRIMRGLMTGSEQRYVLDPSDVMNMPHDQIIVFSPHIPPFPAMKVSIYNSKWMQKMAARPPKDIRELYRQWGIADQPLSDPVIPMIEGYIDTEKMKSQGKTVHVNSTITMTTFRERGGGLWRAPETDADSRYHMQTEDVGEQDERPPDDDDAAAAAATSPF